MNFDRNTVIGFVLLAGLLFTYLYISTQNSHELQAQRQHIEDSVARVKRVADSVAIVKKTDTALKSVVTDTALFKTQGVENTVVVENEVLRVTFTNK